MRAHPSESARQSKARPPPRKPDPQTTCLVEQVIQLTLPHIEGQVSDVQLGHGLCEKRECVCSSIL